MKGPNAPPPQYYSRVIESVRNGRSYPELQQIASSICDEPHLRELELIKKFEIILLHAESPIDLRVNILQTMAALTLSPHGPRFNKHIITRVLLFFKKYPTELARSPRNANRVIQLVKQWQQAGTFAPHIQNQLKHLSIDLHGENTPSIFTKYPKDFLENYRDIQSFPPAITIYHAHVIKQHVLGQLQNVMDRYRCLRKTSRNHLELIAKAGQLKETVYDMMQQLKQALKENRQGAEQLASFFQGLKGKFQSEVAQPLVNGSQALLSESGSQTLLNGAQTLVNGAQTLVNGAQTLMEDV